MGVHNAEAAGFFDRHITNSDGAVSTGLFVVVDHSGIVHLINMVTGEDQHIFRIKTLNKGNVLVNSIGSTLIPFALAVSCVGGQHLGAAVALVKTPGLAVADVLVQFQWLILGQNTDRINVGIDAVTQGEVDDPVFAAKGNCRLCSVLSENLQTAALTTGQKHCDAAFFLEIHSDNSLCEITKRKRGG